MAFSLPGVWTVPTTFLNLVSLAFSGIGLSDIFPLADCSYRISYHSVADKETALARRSDAAYCTLLDTPMA
jgi:hypothetical protein